MGFPKLAYICDDWKKSTPSVICSLNEMLNYVKDKIYIYISIRKSKKKTKELALFLGNQRNLWKHNNNHNPTRVGFTYAMSVLEENTGRY